MLKDRGCNGNFPVVLYIRLNSMREAHRYEGYFVGRKDHFPESPYVVRHGAASLRPEQLSGFLFRSGGDLDDRMLLLRRG